MTVSPLNTCNKELRILRKKQCRRPGLNPGTCPCNAGTNPLGHDKLNSLSDFSLHTPLPIMFLSYTQYRAVVYIRRNICNIAEYFRWRIWNLYYQPNGLMSGDCLTPEHMQQSILSIAKKAMPSLGIEPGHLSVQRRNNSTRPQQA